MTEDMIERRRDTGAVQRDLGRLEGDLNGLRATIEMQGAVSQRDRDRLHQMAADHLLQDRAEHADIGARLDALRADVTGQIAAAAAAIETKLDALVLARAEQRGGWRMLGAVGLGGGTLGGGIATLLSFLSGE